MHQWIKIRNMNHDMSRAFTWQILLIGWKSLHNWQVNATKHMLNKQDWQNIWCLQANIWHLAITNTWQHIRPKKTRLQLIRIFFASYLFSFDCTILLNKFTMCSFLSRMAFTHYWNTIHRIRNYIALKISILQLWYKTSVIRFTNLIRIYEKFRRKTYVLLHYIYN